MQNKIPVAYYSLLLIPALFFGIVVVKRSSTPASPTTSAVVSDSRPVEPSVPLERWDRSRWHKLFLDQWNAESEESKRLRSSYLERYGKTALQDYAKSQGIAVEYLNDYQKAKAIDPLIINECANFYAKIEQELFDSGVRGNLHDASIKESKRRILAQFEADELVRKKAADKKLEEEKLELAARQEASRLKQEQSDYAVKHPHIEISTTATVTQDNSPPPVFKKVKTRAK